MDKGTYEDLQNGIVELETPEIEAWDFKYPGSNTELTIAVPEFTCICPKTGLPDFATIEISYTPNSECIELKSFKEYILFYREVGVFHEHVVNKILNDLVKCISPKWMNVTGVFNARGGIQTTVSADFDEGEVK
ncbi:MAG: preQ(1) synthase [Fibrobacterales bacterium]